MPKTKKEKSAKAFEPELIDDACQTPSARPPRRPSFEGLDFECPTTFIKKFKQYADRLGINEEEDKAAEFLECLSGKAAAFIRTLPASHMPYDALATAVQDEYGSPQVLRRLNINLHKQTKRTTESAVAFTQSRLLLLNRLFPKEDTATTIERLLQLLPEVVAANVALKEPTSVQEFQRCLALVEAALPAPTPRPRTSTTTTNAGPSTSREPPSCQYCPGQHWHRDCPVLQDRHRAGNVTGAGH